jgi:phage-related minor tail protein
MIDMHTEDVIGEFVGGAVLVLIAGVIIYALAAFGNAASSLPGGAQAVSATNYGILAIVTIVGLAGVGGFIKLIQWITEAFDSQWCS